jgi:hypothetical protein
MFRSLLNKNFLRKINIDIISGQKRYINKDYDKVIELMPQEIEYKYKDEDKDSNFFNDQKPEDEPYVRLTDDEIYELSRIKLEKDYPESRWTQVDITQEPYNQIFLTNSDNKFTKTETITDKSLWFWVQRLLPTNQLPDLSRDDTSLKPSGFSLPPKTKPDLPYFIPRTRSKLFPVYRRYQIEGRNKEEYWKNRWDGLFNSYNKKLLEKLDEIKFENNETTLTLTLIQQIQGNIWQFEEDFRGELEELHQRRILSAVNEPNGVLTLKGDFVLDSVKWLIKKGF